MAKDYTLEIFELQRARGEMQGAKNLLRTQIRAEYLAKAEVEIAEKSAEVEYTFARKLKEAVEAGIPQGLLRQKVLKTNTWSIWTYWRDLAEIEPERVALQNKRAKESEWCSWNDDYTVLTVFRTLDGSAIPLPFKCRGFRYVPRFYCEITEFEEGDEREKPYYAQANRLWGEKTYGVLFDMVQPVVEAAIADGLPVQILRDERK